ncbi:MAG: Hsp70 family protein, partial [Bacteroidota bacterium]
MPNYIIGIDLGTTHCVIAYTEADVSEAEQPEIRLFPITQVVGAGEVSALPLLPSFLLLPGPHDVPENALRLPWDGSRDFAVGQFARERGAELPARLVASAKSWLSHAGVDRTADILPFQAPQDARRVSPVEAASRYLRHLRQAWNAQMAQGDESNRLENQTIYLTVPASFDAVARELTVQAANEAGLYDLTLLEEPQAAFYAWINAHKDAWRDAVSVGESILVCDVGGGTTDFSLIQVVEEDGSLDLRRVAVGNHILLGGDNMDLTLA